MAKRATWRMPALNLLQRPTWSRGRSSPCNALRIYLVLAVLMLLVKAMSWVSRRPDGAGGRTGPGRRWPGGGLHRSACSRIFAFHCPLLSSC